MNSKMKWNERYQSGTREPQAARVLVENQHLLPTTGRALDLACGLGGNAILLAQHGLDTQAWDVSEVAISTLLETARQKHLTIHAIVRDVGANPPGPDSFDVIVVSYFLDRKIIPALKSALRPGGMIYYQTFTRRCVSERGPRRTEFRLAHQELLQLFSGLGVLVYREEGSTGDVQQGLRDEAMLVARNLG